MNAYKNAIRKQNSFLAKSRIVPFKGVTMEAMFYLCIQRNFTNPWRARHFPT